MKVDQLIVKLQSPEILNELKLRMFTAPVRFAAISVSGAVQCGEYGEDWAPRYTIDHKYEAIEALPLNIVFVDSKGIKVTRVLINTADWEPFFVHEHEFPKKATDL